MAPRDAALPVTQHDPCHGLQKGLAATAVRCRADSCMRLYLVLVGTRNSVDAHTAQLALPLTAALQWPIPGAWMTCVAESVLCPVRSAQKTTLAAVPQTCCATARAWTTGCAKYLAAQPPPPSPPRSRPSASPVRSLCFSHCSGFLVQCAALLQSHAGPAQVLTSAPTCVLLVNL